MLALSLANSSRDLAALQKLGDKKFDVSPEPAVDAARASFKRATSVTAALEPAVRDRVAGLLSRHDKLLAYFEKDYTDGKRNALGNTLRLIQQTHSELDRAFKWCAGHARVRVSRFGIPAFGLEYGGVSVSANIDWCSRGNGPAKSSAKCRASCGNWR